MLKTVNYAITTIYLKFEIKIAFEIHFSRNAFRSHLPKEMVTHITEFVAL